MQIAVAPIRRAQLPSNKSFVSCDATATLPDTIVERHVGTALKLRVTRAIVFHVVHVRALHVECLASGGRPLGTAHSKGREVGERLAGGFGNPLGVLQAERAKVALQVIRV